jgi:hypothetical protein
MALPGSADAAGDFNDDGDVDGRDFLVWQRGASPAPSGGGLADWQTNYGTGPSAATGDGDTDGRDFLVWQRSYGGTH